jgi:hypothetical protein
MDSNLLKPKQELVIVNLLACTTIEQACKKAKINKATFYNWLNTDDGFKKEYNRRKIQLIENAVSSLSSSVTKAVDVLTGLLDTDNEHLRRLVAKDIIENSIKVVEIDKLEKRIEELENTIKK